MSAFKATFRHWRRIDEQVGQLKAIMILIEAKTRERAMVQAEQAFVRTIGQVLALRDDQPSQGEG